MSNKQTGMVQGVKLFFGIFMVLVYLGMAALLAINFFDWTLSPLWNTVRWFFVIVFAAYGVYRGYREIKGEHTYGMRRDDEDGEQYMNYADRLKEMEGKDNEEKL
ncbi:MAG: hypothetical protein IJK93_08705 [Muribaculaceae bacterium]|nr:hypothetical protein [Muribaculaceae bacterium]